MINFKEQAKDLTPNKVLEESKGFNGKHEVRVIEMIAGCTEGGSDFVDMGLQIMDMKDGETIIRFPRMFLTTKDGKPTESFKRFANLYYLINPNAENLDDIKLKKVEGKVWIEEEKAFGMKSVDQYYQFLNKPIGAVLEVETIFNTKLVNGYNGIPITPKKEDEKAYLEQLETGEYVSVDDYSKNTQPKFSVLKFYDLKTGLTLSELKKGIAPEDGKEVATIIEKLSARIAKRKENGIEDEKGLIQPKRKTAEKLRELRLNALKNSLQKHKKDFDEDRWNSCNSSDFSDEDESIEDSDVPAGW